MATGIVKRHSKYCASRSGGDCSCKPTYQAWVYLERERKKLCRTFPRSEEAKAWRAEALVSSKSGALRFGRDPRTLAFALRQFIEGMQAGRIRPKNREAYKPATVRGYEQHVRRRIAPSPLGQLKVTDVRRRDVQDFADEFLAQGFAPSSVKNMLNPLQVFYRRAVDREEVAFNPTERIDLPRFGAAKKRVASPLEIQQLLQSLDPPQRPLWATAFYAGLRRGELQALRCCDVDPFTRMICVRRGWDQYEGPIAPKSEAGEREVPILDLLEPFLVDHLERTGHRGEDLLFGRSSSEPFVSSTIAYKARECWEAAGLEPLTLHECRHTFASLLIDAPDNSHKTIQRVMGHSKIQTTFDIYGHLLPGGLDEMRIHMNAHLSMSVEITGAQAPSDWSATGAPGFSEDLKDPSFEHSQTPSFSRTQARSTENAPPGRRGASGVTTGRRDIGVSLYMWIGGR